MSKPKHNRQHEPEGETGAGAALSLNDFRDAAAKRIRELTKKRTENTVELGSEFRRVRDTFPAAGQDDDVGAPTSPGYHAKRPGWHDWIRANTDWSPQQVNSFIRVAEKFGERSLPANVSHSLLEFLARDYVPEETRERVLARVEAGEKIGRPQAQEMVREKRSEPKDARPLVVGVIEMDSARLQTITTAQWEPSESELKEIQAIANQSSLISYREDSETLAKIKAAVEENNA